MLQAIRNLFARKSTPVSFAEFVRIAGSVGLYQFKNYESYLEAGSRKLWASWKACDIVATQVMSTPFTLTRRGSTDPVVVPGLSKLLSYVNEHETFADLLYKYTFHMKMTGMAYWLKSEPNFAGNRPLELFALNPGRIKYVVGQSGEITGFMYYSGGKPLPLTLDEVIVFKRPHPNNDYYGLGDFEPAEDMLQEAINRQDYQKAFFKNGAAPATVLYLKGAQATDQESWEKAKREWNSAYGGKDNAGKVSWLTGDWGNMRIGLTNQEMQDLERVKWTVEQIFMLHGVPLSIAGVRDSANFATAEIEDRNFRQYTVYPLVKILQDTLQTDLIEGWGQNLELRFNVAGLTNIGEIAEDLVPLFDRGGISINELREKVGLQRVDNPLFDQHFILSAYTPLDLAGVANANQVDQQAQRMISEHIHKALMPTKGEA